MDTADSLVATVASRAGCSSPPTVHRFDFGGSSLERVRFLDLTRRLAIVDGRPEMRPTPPPVILPISAEDREAIDLAIESLRTTPDSMLSEYHWIELRWSRDGIEITCERFCPLPEDTLPFHALAVDPFLDEAEDALPIGELTRPVPDGIGGGDR